MITVSAWLESFGFAKNPFETTEAGSEASYATEFLHETFVKPDGFDTILDDPSQPKSTIVFAARGQGKTSARLMTAHFCREGLLSDKIASNKKGINRVLPVHHTRFEYLLQGTESQSALVDIHVVEILFRALPALVNTLMRYSELPERIKALNVLSRLELQFFLLAFRTYLSFGEFKFARDLFGKEITSLDEARVPIGFSFPSPEQQNIGLSAQEIENHLGAYAKASPIDLLRRFVHLVTKIGFSAVYILIDCLDEIPETADNFAVAAELLIPLLSNLNLMTNTPFLAFKVFAPSEMEVLLLEATQKVRKDRLFRQEIHLSEEDLGEILTRRLSYCSDGVVTSLDAVCEVELRGQITNELISTARGNPRHLVLLGRYMLENRCRIVTAGDYLLTKADLKVAKARLEREFGITNIASEVHHDTVVQLLPNQGSQIVSEDWFRHELPHPISFSYLVFQRENAAKNRLWSLYELIEASLAFLSQVLLAIMYNNMGDRTSDRLKKSGLRLERTSMGIWKMAMEKLPGLLTGSGVQSYFARACQRVFKRNREFLQAINNERNRSAHGGPQSENICKALLAQYTFPLQEYLEALNFLRRGSLFSVSNVQKRGENYLHQCTNYIGDTFVFPAKEIVLSDPLESGVLWFLCEDGPINLYPFLHVTPGEKIREEVWLYHGLDRESVIYKSYGIGRTMEENEKRSEVGYILGV